MNKLTKGYVNIQGWMTEEPFNLKGHSLIIYAIIYGMSQSTGNGFRGSIQYLMAWTGVSKPTVIESLKNLRERGLVYRKSAPVDDRYSYIYYINNKFNKQDNSDVVFEEGDNFIPEEEVKNIDQVKKFDESVKKFDQEGQKSLPNNIDNIIVNNRYMSRRLNFSNIEEIISYFNRICGTQFRPTSSETKKLITARLKEGFSLEDFKKVIEYKYEEWGKNPFRFKNGKSSIDYLRPATLFGDKFESYLYESNNNSPSRASSSVSESSGIDPNVSDLEF